MYHDRIGYETTVLENIPINELFHMMLSLIRQGAPQWQYLADGVPKDWKN